MQRNRLHWAGTVPWSKKSGSDDCRDHQHKQQHNHTSSRFRIATDHLTVRCGPRVKTLSCLYLFTKATVLYGPGTGWHPASFCYFLRTAVRDSASKLLLVQAYSGPKIARAVFPRARKIFRAFEGSPAFSRIAAMTSARKKGSSTTHLVKTATKQAVRQCNH